MSKRHRKPTASAKKVAKIAVTAAGSQRADHAGSGGRCAGARAGYPLSAMPVKAQYIVRAGVLAFALGIGAAVANTPAVAFAEPTDTSSSASRRLVRRRRRRVRHQNPRQVRQQRIRLRQQIRRPQRRAPRQVRPLGLFRVRLTPKPVRLPHHVTLRRQTHALGLCRVRLMPKPVRPPHRVMLRRQTHALGLCRVRETRTPALPRRAATPPHQLRRRPPKTGCPLPSPQRRPTSHRPPRRPTRNQRPRRPTRNRPQWHPPQSRCHRWSHKKPQHRKPQARPRPHPHRIRRKVSRIRHRIPRAAP